LNCHHPITVQWRQLHIFSDFIFFLTDCFRGEEGVFKLGTSKRVKSTSIRSVESPVGVPNAPFNIPLSKNKQKRSARARRKESCWRNS
jgi:hypothetical protein